MTSPTNDEGTPLLDSSNATTIPPPAVRLKNERSIWSKILNPQIGRTPFWLFEFCDLWIVPPFIRRRCHAMLTATWVHQIPYIQECSPAELAAELVLRTVDEIGYDEDCRMSIIDFCSGAGGPTPTIEKLVNSKRVKNGKQPIPFLLTDIRPHIDPWMEVCSRSSNLSFIPQSVDATDPPIAVTSSRSKPRDPLTGFRSDTRVFRLFCLSFHHFTDPLARKVLQSTLKSSDGFAIIELQDRHLSSLLLICLFFPLQFLVTLFWFWKDPFQILLTYLIPIVPSIVTFDGFVSCLRTRTFEEIVKLCEGDGREIGVLTSVQDHERKTKVVRMGNWVFKGSREIHSWPLGHMNTVVGYKTDS